MDLASLRVRIKNKRSKRLGRGVGSTLGKTSGRGHKGAGQRKGKVLPYAGFRGGNLPLARVLPKRGFNPVRKIECQIVNLGDIPKSIKSNEEITPEVLEKFKLIKSAKRRVKILAGSGEDFSLKLNLKVDKFSSKAKELVESKGGSIKCLNQ